MSELRATPINIHRFREGRLHSALDVVASEEPLEMRIGFGPEDDREQRNIAVTMRTPGHDLELTLGFLFTEAVIQGFDNITHIDHCTDASGKASKNVVRAELHPEVLMDWNKLQRNFYTSSSCGVCGKASIESLQSICPKKVSSDIKLDSEIIRKLPDTMRKAQEIFEHTGGLHASALFQSDGELLLLREDIGRHNALDKIIGAAIFSKNHSLDQCIIVLSGRCCYELVQKTAMAGISVIVSVGAPSSLAVKTADEFGITLIGFVKPKSFNVYAHTHRFKDQD